MLRNRRILSIIGLISCGMATGLSFNKLSNFFNLNSSPPPTQIAAQGTIEVAFSPNNGATQTVVKAITEAKKTILVAAYSFTSSDIAKALLSAKSRGVNVQIILDKSQVGRNYSAATFFANNAFALKIDTIHKIFHDKVMIIDAATVVTGSFNFTRAAETKNAENVLVLRNNPALAKLYTVDWLYNWNQAMLYSDYVAKYHARSDNSNAAE